MASADSRANAILAASVTLSAAAIATMVGQSGPSGNPRLVLMGGTFAVLTIFAALTTFTALWPTAVHSVGWTGASFLGDIRAGKSTRKIKAEVVAHLHARVEGNRDCSSRLARRIKIAMLCLALAPPTALAAGLYQHDDVGGLGGGFLFALCFAFAVYFLENLRPGASG